MHDEIAALLSEGEPREFLADYYAATARGSRTRFQRRAGLMQLPAKARSETAVLAYLRKLHPMCEITIISLEFR